MDMIRATQRSIILATVILVVGCLYWASGLFIPIALAILLTFLLSPVVSALDKFLPRSASVVIVVFLAFMVLGGIVWAIAGQIRGFVDKLPQYTENLQEKIRDIQAVGEGNFFQRIQTAVEEIRTTLAPEGGALTPEEEPIPVVTESSPWSFALPTLIDVLGTSGLTIILVFFMLIQREQLRSRIIRLIGYGRITTTTTALDEAGERVSRYLLVQSLINGSFGLVVGIGLYFIGLPYAVLWGFLAAVLRFIPYLGPWLGAILPIATSLAVFTGWSRSIMVIVLFLAAELFTNMILETIFYSQSAGVSETALLVAVAFWTWLWGGIGLVLATPMTVCLVVLSKHIPQMAFIRTLMSDEEPPESTLDYHQKIQDKDTAGAQDAVEEYLKTHSLEQVYDDLLLPALLYARRLSRSESRQGEDPLQFTIHSTRLILESLETHPLRGGPYYPERGSPNWIPKIRVLGLPPNDEADHLSLQMLAQLLEDAPCDIELIPPRSPSSEIIRCVKEKQPALVIIGGLSPDGIAEIRFLCKRLRARFPDLKIVVGRWGLAGHGKEEDPEVILSEGADRVGMTLRESQAHISELIEAWGYDSLTGSSKKK
jgi:predicted PurR-regulated permease PerM